MDEQRCSAPQILQNLGTPSTQRKDRLISDAYDNPPQNCAKTDEHRQV